MGVAFLLDFDNTLCDNDAARDRMSRETDRILGVDHSKEFWATYEAVRRERGFVDFLATLARWHDADPGAPAELDRAILDLRYADYVYSETLATIAVLWRHGTVVVLSDGDPTFQPLKVARSGVGDAVRGNVLVFEHKERHLADIARLFPAERYVAVDDKATVLARVKVGWRARVSTVHVLQGKYADDPFEGPRPDVTIASIGDLGSLIGTAEGRRVLLEGATIGAGG